MLIFRCRMKIFSINRNGRQLNILMTFWRFVSRYMAISYKKIVNVRRDVFMVEDIVQLSHIKFNNYFTSPVCGTNTNLEFLYTFIETVMHQSIPPAPSPPPPG